MVGSSLVAVGWFESIFGWLVQVWLQLVGLNPFLDGWFKFGCSWLV